MPEFHNQRIIPHNNKLIRDIIMDIEQYPQFIPWCYDAKILVNNPDFLLAELFIEFKTFKKSYISKVTESFQKDHFIIKAVAQNGVFSRLEANWRIKKLNNYSEVDFFIDFEFKSRILGLAMSKIFSVAVEKMADAFEKRADYLSKI